MTEKLFQTEPYQTRLLKLAEHLHGLKTGKKAKVAFDMGTAVFETTKQQEVMNGKSGIDDFCGTVCCAVGSMPMSEYFQQDGFAYRRSRNGYITDVTFQGRSFDFDSHSKKYFGLSSVESDYLFMPGSYVEDSHLVSPTPKTVARRIRKFVQTGKYPEIFSA